MQILLIVFQRSSAIYVEYVTSGPSCDRMTGSCVPFHCRCKTGINIRTSFCHQTDFQATTATDQGDRLSLFPQILYKIGRLRTLMRTGSNNDNTLMSHRYRQSRSLLHNLIHRRLQVTICNQLISSYRVSRKIEFFPHRHINNSQYRERNPYQWCG